MGKTSLANVLSSYLEPFTSETIATARVNCYGETIYTHIWNSLFEQIDIPSTQEYGNLTLNDVFRALREEEDRKLILIVDEFDRIQDPDIDIMFADTIKTLSDFSLDTTLILVGVADDIDDLINRELTAKWPLRANNERSVRATWLQPSEFHEDRTRQRSSREAHVPGFSRLFPGWAYSYCRMAGRALLKVLEITARVILLKTGVGWERHRFLDEGAARGHREWVTARRQKSQGITEYKKKGRPNDGPAQ